MPKKIKTMLAPQPSEFGSTCLAMLLSYYGIRVSLFQTAKACMITPDGCTIKQLRNGAAELGASSEVVEADLSMLMQKKEPCIVTVEGQYAVLERLTAKAAVLETPDRGRIKMKTDEFWRACGKEAFYLAVQASAVKDRVKKMSVGRYALSLITGENFYDALLYGCVLLVISILLALIPHLTSAITDAIFSGGGSDGSHLFEQQLIGALICMMMLILLELLCIPIFAQFSAKVTIGCRKNFLWSAINLPMDFYQIRSDGFFMESAEQVIEVGYFLSKEIVDVLLRPILAVGLLVMMAFVSLPCTIVVAAAVVVMGGASLISAKFEDHQGRIVFYNQCKESNFLMSGLKAIRSIRNSGSEFVFFRDYVKLNRESAKALRPYKGIQKVFAILPAAFGNLAKLALILIGVYSIFRGTLTFGGLVYVHGLYCVVQEYIRTAIFSGQKLMSMKYKIENMQEVCEAKEKEDEDTESAAQQEKLEKLRGKIEVSHISFGYNRFGKKILDDINMEIPAGSSVAIVGASGSGKTTLKKLLTGRYEPWEGQILYDGTDCKNIPAPVMTNSIASVDQQIIMFEDSVMNNIKMWDTTQMDADAILAARDSEIHEEIILREGRYSSLIEEDGGNYSGGQRQRIEIARALSMDPSILVMDEATSALDTVVEKHIVDHVRARGITTIVIAHRLSTIRSCDRIYVMDQGRIVDSGTHDELMQSCELYRKLVTLE